VLDHAALADPGAAADDGEAADAHARPDLRLRADVDRRDQPRVATHARARIDIGEVAAEGLPHLRREVPLEDVAVRLQVRLRRPDVEPVAVQPEPEEAPLLDEPRKDLALDRDGHVRRDQLQHLALEHVEPGVDQVGVDLLGARLLQERADRAVLVQAHEPVAARVRDRREQDRAERAALAVEGGHRGEVGAVEDVSVEREERAVEAVRGEPDAAARSERLRLDAVLEREAVRARAEVLLDRRREIPAAEDGPRDAVAAQVLERIGEERPVDEREHGLGPARGQRAEAGALPADEDHRREAHRWSWRSRSSVSGRLANGELGRPMPS